MMTAQDQRSLHVVVLQMLRAKRDLGRLEDALLNDARMQGHELTLAQLEGELRLLGDKNWIAPMELPLTGKRWRITALGESILTEAKL